MPRLVEQLFDHFAANLAAIRPDLVEKVLCPLCLREFGRDALRDESPEGLSLEHPIPSSIGGNLHTLTCRRCNSTHGSEMDAHLVRQVRARGALSGDGSTQFKGTIEVDGLRLPAKIAWGDGKRPTTFAIPGGSEERIEAFRAKMATMGDGDKMRINFSLDHIEERAQRAMVRLAYLAVFSCWGYAYVLSAAGAWVRSVIDGEAGVELWKLLPDIQDVKEETPVRPLVIFSIGNENITLAYLVVVRIETSGVWHRAVLLPSPIVPKELMSQVLSSVGEGMNGQTYSTNDAASPSFRPSAA